MKLTSFFSTPTLAQQWMRDLWFGKSTPASKIAADTDDLFMYILWLCIISFAIVMIMMMIFVVKYRRRAGVPTVRSASHNTPMELAWSIIPLLTMVPIFFLGFRGYMEKIVSAAGSEEIRITGRQWQWKIEYSNGGLPREMTKIGEQDSPVAVIPAGKPIKLIMTSEDVLHAFFIPDMRMKMDVIPNRYTSMGFQADEAGKSHIVFCAEYCGDQHSQMAAMFKVVTPEEFQVFKAASVGPDPTSTPAQRGKYWANIKFGCNSCHTATGAAGTGPTWKDIWGRAEELADGRHVNVDENYVLKSIKNPQADVVKGFGPPSQMNSYEGLISQEQIDDIIAYMKELSGKSDAAPAAPPGDAKPSAKPDAAKPESKTPAAPEHK